MSFILDLQSLDTPAAESAELGASYLSALLCFTGIAEADES
ncbi:SapB/AmfS family lanthipeptide [Nocardiopsis trehalosi]|jgi:hypothetical protein|nr:SapB/AmfS family lanthipeptide [Nocardiopsis trehalosi]